MGFRSKLRRLHGFVKSKEQKAKEHAEKVKDKADKDLALAYTTGSTAVITAAKTVKDKADADLAAAKTAVKNNTKNLIHKFDHTAKNAGKELVNAEKDLGDAVTKGEDIFQTADDIARTAVKVKKMAVDTANDASKTVNKVTSGVQKLESIPEKISTAVKTKAESEVNTAAAGLSKASNTIVNTVKDVRRTVRKDSSNVKEHVEHLTAPVKALAKHVGDAVEKGEAEVSGAKEETKNLIENGADKLDVVSHAIAKNVMRDINNVKQDAKNLKNGAVNAIGAAANEAGSVIVGELEKAEHTVYTLGKAAGNHVKILAHNGEHMLVETTQRFGAGAKNVVGKVKTDTATVIHATHLDTVAHDLTKLVSHMAASAPCKSLAAHAKKAADDAKAVAVAAESAAASAVGAAKEDADKAAAIAKKAAETAAADAADALKRLTEDTAAHLTHMARAADKIVHKIADIPKEVIEKVRHHEREHKVAVEAKKTKDTNVIKGHTEDMKRIHKAAMDGYNKMVKHFDGIEIPDTQALSDETFGYPAQDLTDLVYVLANDYPGVSLGSASRFSMF